jgi:hypothetical protein
MGAVTARLTLLVTLGLLWQCKISLHGLLAQNSIGSGQDVPQGFFVALAIIRGD